MKKYTNKDIARMAGVSPAAVSLAINHKKGVSEATRAHILDIVKKVKYLPNPNSRRLLAGRTNNIAVLARTDLRPIDRFFYTELTSGILDSFNQDVINLIFTALKDSGEDSRLPQIIRARDIDGVLIFGDIDDSVLDEIDAYEIPFVILDSSKYGSRYLTVSANYTTAAYTATNFLLRNGHVDIAYLGNGSNSQVFFNDAVLSGFRQALAEYNLAIPENRIQVHVQDEASLVVSIERLLKGKKRPTAIFCSTDVYGCNTIKYLNEHGYRLPDDMSVIGIDDILISQFTQPALTTVRIDPESMGRMGYELLQRRIAGETCASILCPSADLIVRDSVKRR